MDWRRAINELAGDATYPALLVFDNFLDDPMALRKTILGQSFMGGAGRFPGKRASSFYDEALFQSVRCRIEARMGCKIIEWPDPRTHLLHNCVPQLTTSHDRTWIHHDGSWLNGVLFLTPQEKVGPLSGTALMSHIETGWGHKPVGIELEVVQGDIAEGSKWKCDAYAENVFNRLVIIDDFHRYHTAMDYFGEGLHDGRLTMVFFFRVDPRTEREALYASRCVCPMVCPQCGDCMCDHTVIS